MRSGQPDLSALRRAVLEPFVDRMDDAEENDDVTESTTTILVNHQKHYGRMALFMANQAKVHDDALDGDCDPQQHDLDARDASAVGAILLSAAQIEARISELLVQIAHPHRRQEPWLITRRVSDQARTFVQIADSTKADFSKRIKILAAAMNVEIDQGQTPFQEGRLLYTLRNRLVHLAPTYATVDSDQEAANSEPDGEEKLLQQLRSYIDDLGNPRYTLSGGVDSFLYLVMTPQVAQWAASTAADVVAGLNQRLGAD